MEKIQVGVRVRSLLDDEKGSQWCVKDNSIHQARSPGQQFPPETYQFDHVFGPEVQTTEIFEVLGKPIVEGVINGFNGTIFAYGQTNSGKTYTMVGDEGSGIIPQACIYLFDRLEEDKDREFVVRMSYMEIYNEQLTDLLNPDPYRRLKIREDAQRIIPIYVDGLHEVSISSVYDFPDLLRMGDSNRTVGETLMNKQSSRSHSLLTITVESRSKENSESVKLAALNLVDLAGSERARSTGAKGVRLTESTYINKSLFNLGSVISKLSDGKSHAHIPYRDSKLTRILQPSLGGNAMTTIICTVSPTVVEETHSTLQFATRAKKISNKPVVNEVVLGEAELRKQLVVATDKIIELKEQLASSTSDQEKQFLRERLAASEELREKLSQRNTYLEEQINIIQPSKNKPDYKQRHSMFARSKPIDTLTSLPTTPAVFISPAVTRTRSRFPHSTFLPMQSLSSTFSPTDTEEFNDADFRSPYFLTLTADRSTQTPSSLEKTTVSMVSTSSGRDSSSLEQSTQTEKMAEYKTHISCQSTQTEEMTKYKAHSDGISCQSTQTEETTVSVNHTNGVASHEQSTQTTVSKNHCEGAPSSLLEQSSQTEEVTVSIDAQAQPQTTASSTPTCSVERSTQTQSLGDLILNATSGECVLSSLDISCNHRRQLGKVEEDLEIANYEKDEVIINNEFLESVVTDLQQNLTQSAERRDISMVEKQELDAKLRQLKFEFEKADQVSIEVVQQNTILKEAHAELQMQYKDIEQKFAKLQVQCASLEQKSQLQQSQLADKDGYTTLLEQELAEKTHLLTGRIEELNSLKEKLQNNQDRAQKIGMDAEEVLRMRTSEIDQLKQQLAKKTHSLTDLEEELAALKGKLKQEEEKSGYYTSELSQAQQLRTQMIGELTQKDSKICQLEQQLAELERSQSLTEELSALKEELKDTSNYYTAELSKAEQLQVMMTRELTEKDLAIQQLEQQLEELEKSSRSYTEELAALKMKLKHEDDMSEYYTAELTQAQKNEEEMDKELEEKDMKIHQLEQLVAELKSSAGQTEELTALREKLKHEEEMTNYYNAELSKAQQLKVMMTRELTEKDSAIQQLEQQLEELEKSSSSYTEELAALKAKLKHEEDMSEYYTAELTQAQKNEEEMDKELTGKNMKIHQLEQQVAKLESSAGQTEELTALREKLKHEEEMSNHYTAELTRAQKLKMRMTGELTEKDLEIHQLQQQLAELEKSSSSYTEELAALKMKLKHEEDMAEYYTTELTQAQKNEEEMDKELEEKNVKVHQLEQQLAELASHTEELTALREKLKREESMSNYYTAELTQAQKNEEEMDKELMQKETRIDQLEQQLTALREELKREEEMSNYYTAELTQAQKNEEEIDKELMQKETKIHQLEQQLAEKSGPSCSHMEELAALKEKLKQGEAMSDYYTTELMEAQKLEKKMDDEIAEKNSRIEQLEQQADILEKKLQQETNYHTSQLSKAQQIEGEMKAVINEKDARIKQLEQQLKEKDENLGSVKSELPHTASSLSDKEQLRPQQKKVAIVPARRYPLAHQQQPSSLVTAPPDVNESYTREELILKIQILERHLAHASGGAIVGMQIRVSELEKENDRLRRQVQIEACRHRDYRGIELPDAVSVMKFDEMRCELRDLQQKSESDQQKLSKLMSENDRLKKALQSENELSKRYHYERSVYRAKYEHLKSQRTEVAGQQETVTNLLPPAPEPYRQVPRPEYHQEINPPTTATAVAAPDKPSECKPQ